MCSKIKLEFKRYQNIRCSEDKIYALEVTEKLFPVVLEWLRYKNYLLICKNALTNKDCFMFKRHFSCGDIRPSDYLSVCDRCSCGDIWTYRPKSFLEEWRLLDDDPLVIEVDMYLSKKE
jgi:hypothetical protein